MHRTTHDLLFTPRHTSLYLLKGGVSLRLTMICGLIAVGLVSDKVFVDIEVSTSLMYVAFDIVFSSFLSFLL